jgi:lipopolysaccharide transport system ATP-binding protein
MSDFAIRAEGLSKRYALGRQPPERYASLRDAVTRGVRSCAGAAFRPGTRRTQLLGDAEEFWALQDVSFEVKTGDVVGIIGRNGAGKSTLLKILSRITEPTAGRIELGGRVASLLEVGTGFHPELTGRENVFLNGAILGMRRSEIARKFDEIVAFAGVEKFLDTPVKRFSSGMYVRLAFAVAAHLEPEILVIDEVLAVGDAEFQRQCLGKMQSVAGEGRTVLFVSHNLAAVRTLCNRGLLLAGGKVVAMDSVEAVIRRYVASSSDVPTISFAADPSRPSITSISVDKTGLTARDLIVEIAFASPRPMANTIGGIVLRADTGEPVWGTNGRFHPSWGAKRLSGGTLTCEARGLPMRPGTYHLSAWLGDWHEDFDAKLDVLSFELGEEQTDRLRPSAAAVGHVDWPASWHVRAREGATAA